MAERLGIVGTKGVVVQDVKQGSFAEDLGLNRGDVILEVNKQQVNNPADFTKIESSLKSGQDVVFLCARAAPGRRTERFSWPAHFHNRAIIRRDWRSILFLGTIKDELVSPVFLLKRSRSLQSLVIGRSRASRSDSSRATND